MGKRHGWLFEPAFDRLVKLRQSDPRITLELPPTPAPCFCGGSITAWGCRHHRWTLDWSIMLRFRHRAQRRSV